MSTAAKKKHKSNPQWIRRHVTDPYVKAATQRGYRARSAFKLIEIDDKERLLRPGAVVIDLGAVPGSWCQVARERLAGRLHTAKRVAASRQDAHGATLHFTDGSTASGDAIVGGRGFPALVPEQAQRVGDDQ